MAEYSEREAQLAKGGYKFVTKPDTATERPSEIGKVEIMYLGHTH